jgi:hypothetical protein
MPRRTHQSGAWYKRSDRQLARDPLCLCCFAVGRATPATVADHVIPVSNGGDLLRGELQSACRRCHDGIKRKLEQLYRQGKCTAADLRLDSAMARQLACRQRGVMRFGVDGHPLDPNDPSNAVRTYPIDLPPEPVQWVLDDDRAEAAAPEPPRSLPRHIASLLARGRQRTSGRRDRRRRPNRP